MAEIILKDTRTNRDCIKIWELINDGVLLRDLQEAIYGDGGRIENFQSNLTYCIHKLHQLTCIELHTSRNTDGKFGATLITQSNKPIIKKNLCSQCQKIAPQKSHNSKYKDICTICTKELIKNKRMNK